MGRGRASALARSARAALLAGAVCIAAAAAPAAAQSAEALRARHAALRPELADNPFGRPLHVESEESAEAHKGDIYAVIAEPFRRIGPALEDARAWCDILILPPNVKRCRAAGGGEDRLTLYIARRSDETVKAAYRVDFAYEVAAAHADYLHVALHSPAGPFGTQDYRISAEAAPLDGERTFLHLSYSYVPGLAARMAMDLYLATSGRDKVGFSIVGRRPDGRPEYIRGVRGVVERNTMRYYLAIEAYLDTLAAPPGKRLETRLSGWHAAIERYPLQLREMPREEYLAMKRREARPPGP